MLLALFFVTLAFIKLLLLLLLLLLLGGQLLLDNQQLQMMLLNSWTLHLIWLRLPRSQLLQQKQLLLLLQFS